MTTPRLYTIVATIAAIFMAASTASARDLDKHIPSIDASAIVTPPSFPGGEESMMSSILDNLTTFHLSAGEACADVMVSCVVGTDGNITRVDVDGKASPRMTSRVKQAVERLPQFEPATASGRNVEYRLNFPLLISSTDE